MAQLTISIDDETKERLLELAGSPRKQGELITELVNAEWQRRHTGIVMLAQRVEDLEREVRALRQTRDEAQ